MSMVRGSGIVSSDVSSGVAGCSGGSDLGHSSDSCGSGALSIRRATATTSSSVGGSDMVDDDDINDAVDDGSSGRERRRSFWRLSGARHGQDVFQRWCSFARCTTNTACKAAATCAAMQGKNDSL